MSEVLPPSAVPDGAKASEEIAPPPPRSKLEAEKDDLSGSGEASAADSAKAAHILDDARARRNYRRYAVWANVAVLAVLVASLIWVLFAFTQQADHLMQISASAAKSQLLPAVAAPLQSASSPSSGSIGGASAVLASSGSVSVEPTKVGPTASPIPPFLRLDLTAVTTSMVAVVTILVIAMTVLAIALLRLTFSSADGGKEDASGDKPKGVEGLPGLEMAKAVLDAIGTAMKGVTGGRWQRSP